jgi:hypothetical protein
MNSQVEARVAAELHKGQDCGAGAQDFRSAESMQGPASLQ